MSFSQNESQVTDTQTTYPVFPLATMQEVFLPLLLLWFWILELLAKANS